MRVRLGDEPAQPARRPGAQSAAPPNRCSCPREPGPSGAGCAQGGNPWLASPSRCCSGAAASAAVGRHSLHILPSGRTGLTVPFATSLQAKEKVAIIGSGNWGSAIAKIIGRNVLAKDNFDDEVNMWVFEEQVDGRNLTDIINTEHENVKYLPVSAHAHHRVAGAHIRRWPLASLV